jgi:hypothetical protein
MTSRPYINGLTKSRSIVSGVTKKNEAMQGDLEDRSDLFQTCPAPRTLHDALETSQWTWQKTKVNPKEEEASLQAHLLKK